MNGKLKELPPETGVRKAVLPLILLSLGLVVSAVPALNVAIPNLASDTGASMSQLQWIVDAYALVFAALLLPAGAVGDRYGRKPVLVWGLALFALGAAGAALTTTPNVLIGFRGVMGLGAALVMPSTLSIITTSLPKDRRSKAVAAWVGVAGAGAIVGLVAAGALLEAWGWASVFWLYAVAALVICIAALRLIPNSVVSNPPRVDYVGGLLSVVTLTAFVYGTIEGPERGWADVGRSGHSPWAAWPSSRGSSGASTSRSRCWIRDCSRCADSAPAWHRSQSSSSSSSASCSSSSSTCSSS